MRDARRFLWLFTGIVLGVAGAGLYLLPSQPAQAANDRWEDYILCTGPVGILPTVGVGGAIPPAQTDGVWLLDYRAGKLLGTVIDRAQGKIAGWAEVDLVAEFGIGPRQNVHFLMTTGNVAQGQAALYVAETTSGKLGVYTMGARLDGQPGLGIRRHDLASFRQPVRAGNDPFAH
jgi:hypothetical protein